MPIACIVNKEFDIVAYIMLNGIGMIAFSQPVVVLAIVKVIGLDPEGQGDLCSKVENIAGTSINVRIGSIETYCATKGALRR